MEITYKNAQIHLDKATYEWVACINPQDSEDSLEISRNTSLDKLKASVDRYNSRNFNPLPIYFFDKDNKINYAEIVSFTTEENVCWIKHTSGYKEGKRERINVGQGKKIYSSENIFNEQKLIEMTNLEDEIRKKIDELQTLNRDKIQLISQLQQFDISGLVVTAE